MEKHSDLFGVESIIGKTNELHVNNLGGGTNTNPWAANDSASRAQMYTSHLSQVPVIAQPSVRRTLTGVEREYGRYTFQQKIPEEGQFIRVIDKYPTQGAYRFSYNPQKLAVYRSNNPKYPNGAYFGVMDVSTYNIRHQYFGFMYKPKGNRMNMLVEGGEATEGMVIATSPSIDQHENYLTGVSSNMLYMSLHTTIEDGVLANSAWLERYKSVGIESRAGTWGNRCYPIGLYSSNGVYRAHPEIGQKIAPHGILYAIREYDELLAVVDMTEKALSEPDFIFDQLVYGKPGAEVIDITVFHDHNLDRVNNDEKTPKGIDAQSRRYYDALFSQQNKLIDMYETLKRQHGERLVLHPNLHRMIVWAYAFTNHKSVQQPDGARVNMTYRRAPVGDFRTEIVFKYDIVPSVGSKVTTMHGGKGVIVQIRKPEDMPRWPDGTTADLVMDNDSNIKRMNLGGVFEQATNAFGAQMTRRVHEIMGVKGVVATAGVGGSLNNQSLVDQAYEELMEFYGIASPYMAELMRREISHNPTYRMSHVTAVCNDGIYLWLPPHTEDIGATIIDRLESRYGLEMHPVTYRDSNGQFTTTKQKMLIGETYIIMLEKNGFDWSSVASPKRQHFGILARMTNMDKHSTPGRENAVRITGEAEIRLLSALVPDYVVADLLDRPNNPAAHKAEVRSILEAKNPAQIELAVDRNKVPLGGNRAIQFIKHIMWCCGISLRSLGKRAKGIFK